jgi:hypothetical protein
MVRNNETFGMSAEIAMCKVYKCETSPEENRGDKDLIEKLIKLFENNKEKLGFSKLEYTGEKGNPVDFIDSKKDSELNKTISIKTNMKNNDKVCPQEIGQCTKEKFKEKLYSKILKIDDPFNQIDDKKIKEFILSHIKLLIPLYFDKLFCCDILVHIKPKDDTYELKIINKENLKLSKIKEIFKKVIFTFTKDKVENWNESNTVYIQNDKDSKDKLTLGEFQIHKNRNCIKFRFNYSNLITFLEKKELIN